MKLPLLLSVPHAGLAVPAPLASRCLLTPEEIVADGDEGARQIYDLEAEVAGFVTTEVARAVLDMNRAEDDLRKDGVVKTHTCWEVPIWSSPLGAAEAEDLLERFHRPYHRRLRELAGSGVILGVDCHTMAAVGPPVGPDSGRVRPALCLGDGGGACPREIVESLAEALSATFGEEAAINDPFSGGYISRSHAAELPWVQLELSRAPNMTFAEKREAVLEALRRWVAARP